MYRGLQPLDEEFQTRHEQQQRMLAATLTMHEAGERYGISSKALYRRLKDAGCWPAITGRWWIADIEAALHPTHPPRQPEKPRPPAEWHTAAS